MEEITRPQTLPVEAERQYTIDRNGRPHDSLGRFMSRVALQELIAREQLPEEQPAEIVSIFASDERVAAAKEARRTIFSAPIHEDATKDERILMHAGNPDEWPVAQPRPKRSTWNRLTRAIQPEYGYRRRSPLAVMKDALEEVRSERILAREMRQHTKESFRKYGNIYHEKSPFSLWDRITDGLYSAIERVSAKANRALDAQTEAIVETFMPVEPSPVAEAEPTVKKERNDAKRTWPLVLGGLTLSVAMGGTVLTGGVAQETDAEPAPKPESTQTANDVAMPFVVEPAHELKLAPKAATRTEVSLSSGDSIWQVSEDYLSALDYQAAANSVPVVNELMNRIIALNDFDNPDTLSVGTTVKLPSQKIVQYIVQQSL